MRRTGPPGSRRLAEFDIVERMKPVPAIISQALFAGACIAVTLLVRLLLDQVMPGAEPLPLTMPAVLVATLFGRWQAGVICETVLAFYAWYFVLPDYESFRFAYPEDGPMVLTNLVAGYAIVALADVFRRAVRRSVRERDLFMDELEHRVKNSFASVASVLRLQRLGTSNPEVLEALGVALGRIESFAQAYSLLARADAGVGKVELSSYLKRLCTTLEDAGAKDLGVRIRCQSEGVVMDKDKASTIGLLINEVVTNSLKHAFDGGGGEITVRYAAQQGRRVLSIADDGKGMEEATRPGALGMKLIEGLAAHARAETGITTSSKGTTITFVFPDAG